MDQLLNIGVDMPLRQTAEPTIKIFLPLLEKHRTLIAAVPKKTLKYGETERHCLDVYYPPTPALPGSKTPILFWFYGGGFITGSRNLPPPADLLYSCVGAFFAQRGFITIIPDYRLAPEFQYPKPVEDVLGAIEWVVSHPTNIVSETTPNPDTDTLILAGHSAGASIAATIIVHPTLLPPDSELRKKIKCVFLMSGPYQYLTGIGETDRFTAYWGSEERARDQSALSLLFSSLDKLPKEKLPKICIVEGEREPLWFGRVRVDFRRLLEWHLGEGVPMFLASGHNHISLTCSMSTGEGEEWGVQVVEWIWGVLRGQGISEVTPGADPMEDVKESEAYECPNCHKRRTRSFTIEFGSISVSARTFIRCVGCGHKWTQD
ncbi:alpha/beta-hydrolase [Macrolepiota fuliginosa MF-IS2]|uniref:Alpha/beta-hydrolase n=1 Tax=Macrolepiota fuliginosa MF-IS2 TaxID=1400762 RepID=A0A9P5XGC5_9AGAR|nr:alpha/beta-hydrolase [Macrolepiota fuliginosa MF-IS2]